MNPPDPHRTPPPARDLEVEDLTQEIDTPLADYMRGRDEPTLSRIDFEDIEIALDF
jgi:hypothetical protein